MATRWTQAHVKQREAILDLLTEEARPFEDTSDAAKDARRRLPILPWCQTYMPHYFRSPFAAFHTEMNAAAGEPCLPTFIAAFRGAAKSTFFSVVRPLRRTLERRTPYTIFGSQVQVLAAQNMDYVRIELEENPRIACDYGELSVEGSEDAWTVHLPPAASRGAAQEPHRIEWAEAKFEAFGVRQSVRGRRHGPWRPFDFVGDDLEDDAVAANPRREQQLWDWLMGGVLPAMEPDVFTFTVVGTFFGPLCMLVRARELAEVEGPGGRPLARYYSRPAVDATGGTVWPERFSDEHLARIRATQGLKNWLRNYALEAHDPDKPFQAQWIDAHRYDPAKVRADRLDVVGYLDPAVSESASGCPRALVIVGADRQTGVRYVLDVWIGRGTPAEMVRRIFDADEEWHPRVIGIESNGGFILLKDLVDEEMRKRNRWLPLDYSPATQSKESRIERLAKAFEAGRWRFPTSPHAGIQTLEQQFVSYPDGWKDGPDAAAGCDAFLPAAFRSAAPGPIYQAVESAHDFAEVL